MKTWEIQRIILINGGLVTNVTTSQSLQNSDFCKVILTNVYFWSRIISDKSHCSQSYQMHIWTIKKITADYCDWRRLATNITASKLSNCRALYDSSTRLYYCNQERRSDRSQSSLTECIALIKKEIQPIIFVNRGLLPSPIVTNHSELRPMYNYYTRTYTWDQRRRSDKSHGS